MVLTMLPENEGLVLKELMESPFGCLISHLVESTGKSRSAVKRAIGELRKKGVVLPKDDVPSSGAGTYSGFQFAPLRFPELEYD